MSSNTTRTTPAPRRRTPASASNPLRMAEKSAAHAPAKHTPASKSVEAAVVLRDGAGAPVGMELNAGTRSSLRLYTKGRKAHSSALQGLDIAQAARLKNSLRLITDQQFFQTLGISARTFQRHAAARSALDVNASDRAQRLAAALSLAMDVLGSHDQAERWLAAPAIGLDQHTPLELLQTSAGTDMVTTLLHRMDRGVYA